MNSSQIESFFNKISKGPCWNVEKGIGSFLTFEFGKPQIEFTEPKVWSQLKYPLNQNKIRRVFLKGTEKLWIYCVDWIVYYNETAIAHNESKDEQINIAANVLNGQILELIEIDTESGETKFKFDLGGILTTCNRTHNEKDESWMLFVKDSVLTMNNSGQFNFGNSNQVSSNETFVTINEKQIKVTLHNK